MSLFRSEGETLTREELENAVQVEKRRLSKRFAYIHKHVDEDLIIPAQKKYREILDEYGHMPLNKMQDQFLINLYRDLKYVEGLNTSHTRGVRVYQTSFQDIDEFLEQLSPDSQDEFWDIYGRLVDESAMSYNYKYDIFHAIKDEMLVGKSTDDIYFELKRMYLDGDMTTPNIWGGHGNISSTDPTDIYTTETFSDEL